MATGKGKIPVRLLQTVEKLGREGEEVYVKPGHMRITLYPNRQAVYVTRKIGPVSPSVLYEADKDGKVTVEKLQKQQEEIANSQKYKLQLLDQQEKILKNIEALKQIGEIRFKRRRLDKGESDEIYGSVTINDVITVLRNQYQVNIVPGKDIIECEEKIKRLGEFPMKIIFSNNQQSLKKKTETNEHQTSTNDENLVELKIIVEE